MATPHHLRIVESNHFEWFLPPERNYDSALHVLVLQGAYPLAEQDRAAFAVLHVRPSFQAEVKGVARVLMGGAVVRPVGNIKPSIVADDLVVHHVLFLREPDELRGAHLQSR